MQPVIGSNQVFRVRVALQLDAEDALAGHSVVRLVELERDGVAAVLHILRFNLLPPRGQ